ncbi:hypothetical protein [Streptomyces sp. NPDC056387]|uniref:hypothetical protein n=1 Tax=Streptomyces sp. NPDC056387 TaxID=3345803 RepID=UPI0035DC9020
MAAAIETPTDQQTLLGVLVRQRRVALGYTQAQGSKACDLSGQTYWNIEHGRPVSATTYAKVEHGYGMRAGSCRAVLEGADSITLDDGTELIAGGQIQRADEGEIADDIRTAVNSVARLTAPDLSHRQTEEMTAKVMDVLRKRGFFPDAS